MKTIEEWVQDLNDAKHIIREDAKNTNRFIDESKVCFLASKLVGKPPSDGWQK